LATQRVAEARLGPVAQQQGFSGPMYQQLIRSLRMARNKDRPTSIGGFEEYYRNALSDIEGGLTRQVDRTGDPGLVTDLSAANTANRNIETLANAVRAGRSGVATGEIGGFTPFQLQTAGHQTATRYPGPRPFAELADAAQQVLPQTIPNSATADRAAQGLLGLSILGGAGAGYGGADEGGEIGGAAEGAGIPLAGLLALAAGGSRIGQRAMTGALVNRNATSRWLGDQIARRSGIIGSASLPLAFTQPEEEVYPVSPFRY